MPKSIANGTKHDRFKELDALRGIAALMVVLFHLSTVKPDESLSGFKLGLTGVELFFMISGFVIYMSLTTVKTSLQFVINRVSRLYPTYWACVTLTFIFICIKGYFYISADAWIPDIWDYLVNMTMFQYYMHTNDIDVPYWTLIVEMLFYITMVLLLQFKLLRYINAIGVSTSLVLVAITAFFHQDTFATRAIAAFPLLSFVPLFFSGIIFYEIYKRKEKLFERYAMLLLYLVCQVCLFAYRSRPCVWINQTEYAAMVSVYFLLFTLFVNGKLKFIINRVSLFLGKISFPLYLIHLFVACRFIVPFLTKECHVNFWIASFVIALPMVLFLAHLINIYIEIPLSRQMRDKLNAIRFKEPVQEVACSNVPVKTEV
jgi:peptidoglycan/LPS O-acetylase OafA/YrhL